MDSPGDKDALLSKYAKEVFFSSPPSPQNAISIFPHWATRFPEHAGIKTTGTAGLFEDAKIHWLNDCLLGWYEKGFSGLEVLELGPLEGGHTHMMSKLGAKRIDAVEANSLAFLKCLVSKEVMRTENAFFHLGDAVQFLDRFIADNAAKRYDLAVCSGFLYHMQEPVELIKKLAKCATSLYVWTNTYNEEMFVKQPLMRARFGPPVIYTDGDFSCELYPHHYGDVQNYSAFWGSGTASCFWLKPEDVVRVIEHAGFRVQRVRHEDNPYGVAVNVFATL